MTIAKVLRRVALLLTAAAGTVEAQFAAPSTLVSTSPEAPARGSAIWLRVEDDPSRNDQERMTAVEGEAAGEPLHFERAEGGFAALLGIPVDGDDTLVVTLHLVRPSRADSMVVPLAVRQPSYHRERLSVAPRMVEYDSATQARIDAESARAREVSRRAHETPRLWSQPIVLPRSSRITSPYGGAREYNGKVTSRHTGTDFAGAVGTPVVAAARGVVALVANFYLAGRAVYLDHGAGLVTAYFHLSRVDVAQGDTVSAGQRIGAVGRSGRVTGPHLHWVVRYGAVSVDGMASAGLWEQRDSGAAGPRGPEDR